MIVDSSAVLAILKQEPEADRLTTAIGAAPAARISAANYLEAAIVAESERDEAGARDLDLLVHKFGLEVVSFTPSQADIARRAYRRFGRGHHRAALNFGDCFAYALAKETGETLLFKGNDFSRTDIPAAAY